MMQRCAGGGGHAQGDRKLSLITAPLQPTTTMEASGRPAAKRRAWRQRPPPPPPIMERSYAWPTTIGSHQLGANWKLRSHNLHLDQVQAEASVIENYAPLRCGGSPSAAKCCDCALTTSAVQSAIATRSARSATSASAMSLEAPLVSLQAHKITSGKMEKCDAGADYKERKQRNGPASKREVDNAGPQLVEPAASAKHWSSLLVKVARECSREPRASATSGPRQLEATCFGKSLVKRQKRRPLIKLTHLMARRRFSKQQWQLASSAATSNWHRRPLFALLLAGLLAASLLAGLLNWGPAAALASKCALFNQCHALQAGSARVSKSSPIASQVGQQKQLGEALKQQQTTSVEAKWRTRQQTATLSGVEPEISTQATSATLSAPSAKSGPETEWTTSIPIVSSTTTGRPSGSAEAASKLQLVPSNREDNRRQQAAQKSAQALKLIASPPLVSSVSASVSTSATTSTSSTTSRPEGWTTAANGPSELTSSKTSETPDERHTATSESVEDEQLSEAIREALDELASSSQQAATSEWTPSLATPALVGTTSGATKAQARTKHRGHIEATASQSVPSVSLPPISHLLTPRNPFKLFASASGPIASRYWPTLTATLRGSESEGGRTRTSPQQASQGWPSAAHSATQQQQQQQQAAAAASHAQYSEGAEQAADGSLVSLASSFAGGSWRDEPASVSAGQVYAHSHSAEQLEQLVRAASQAGHLPRDSPPILAAIVSAPGGQTFPGFYIPALEPSSASSASSQWGSQSSQGDQAQESRANEEFVRALGGQPGDSLSSPSGGQQVAAGALSTIPGTDYVLHPDEVRAMMNIGELAWRKQHSAEQQRSVSAASAMASEQLASASPSYWHLGSPNLMEENHLENARNYAYQAEAEQRPQGDHMRGAHSAPEPSELAARGQPQQNASYNVGVARQVAHHRQRLPALIRVNDQDYVHWPLIQMAASGQRQQQQQQARRRWPLAQAAAVAHEAPPGVRLATQLTAGEIRQVEESILETLMMAQTLQHQQKIMAALGAAAAQPQRHLAGEQPRAPARWHHRLRHTNGGRRLVFARRRRRRNSPTSNHSNKQHQEANEHQKALAASQHFISMLPIMSEQALVNFSQQQRQQLAPQVSLASSLEPQSVESALVSVRLPALLADQETNKAAPRLEPLAHSGAMLQAEASATRASVFAPAQAFGSRVRASNSSSSAADSRLAANAQQQRRLQPTSFGQLLASSESLRLAQAAAGAHQQQQQQASVAKQFVTFVPVANNRERQISLYKAAQSAGGERDAAEQQLQDTRGGQQVVAVAASRALPTRINVDWPAMTSDADYFPERPSAHKSAAASARQLERVARREPASQLKKQLVSTQLKLQFAQDYQAREGVPIYNNNVRLNGAQLPPLEVRLKSKEQELQDD